MPSPSGRWGRYANWHRAAMMSPKWRVNTGVASDDNADTSSSTLVVISKRRSPAGATSCRTAPSTAAPKAERSPRATPTPGAKYGHRPSVTTNCSTVPSVFCWTTLRTSGGSAGAASGVAGFGAVGFWRKASRRRLRWRARQSNKRRHSWTKLQVRSSVSLHTHVMSFLTSSRSCRASSSSSPPDMCSWSSDKFFWRADTRAVCVLWTSLNWASKKRVCVHHCMQSLLKNVQNINITQTCLTFFLTWSRILDVGQNDRQHSIVNAAFTCYRNYRKYEFPNRKLDVNGLSSRIYYWEIRK